MSASRRSSRFSSAARRTSRRCAVVGRHTSALCAIFPAVSSQIMWGRLSLKRAAISDRQLNPAAIMSDKIHYVNFHSDKRRRPLLRHHHGILVDQMRNARRYPVCVKWCLTAYSCADRAAAQATHAPLCWSTIKKCRFSERSQKLMTRSH
jgi:hypothetical protein